MKITKNIYMIASGVLGGYRFTHPFDCNVFMIDTGDGCIVVDSGGGLEPERIDKVVEELGFKMTDIKKLILTHYHVDHAGGGAHIWEKSGCDVYAPIKEVECIRNGDEVANGTADSKARGMVAPDYVFRACPTAIGLDDGDVVTLGNVSLTAYTVNGHSEQDLIVVGDIDGKQCMFCGDYVFCNGEVFLQACPGCDLTDYTNGMNRLSTLKVDSIFPGHGVFALNDGIEFINKSLSYWNSGMLPPQLFLMK